MVDYAAIADRAEQIIGSADPAKYQLAYDQMITETTTHTKPGEVRMNRRMVMGALGAATGDAILAKVFVGLDNSGLSAAGIASIKADIDTGEGIDLNNPETQAMLQGFVNAGILTQAEMDQLMSLTQETVPAWPGLLPGHVQNALEKRAAGEV